MNEKNAPLARIADLLFAIRSEPDLDTRIEALAARAGFSPFHFQRIFRIAVGETIGEYLRSRRLQRGAYELRATKKSVTEIAGQSGYETPSAFTRAFSAAYDRSPTEYRSKEGSDMTATPSFVIEERPACRLLGVRQQGSYTEAGRVWKRLVEHALARGIYNTRTQRVGLSWDDPGRVDVPELRYAACIESDAEVDETLEEISIKSGRWAVVMHRGPYELIGERFDRLLREVVLERELELRAAPAIEWYLNNPRVVAAHELQTELRLPIV